MESRTKRVLDAARLDALVRRAVGAGVVTAEELADGYANAVWRLTTDDGRRLVLKLSPPPELEQLTYERGLLRTEARVYELCAKAGVPVPELVRAGFDDPVLGGDYLVLADLDGVPWNRAGDRLSEEQQRAIRRELGGHMARFNAITGTEYGYPSGAPAGPTWRVAFLAMVRALLADSRRYGIALPLPPAEIAAIVEGAAGALDDVRTPSLVHFDIWPGNVFLTFGDGPPRIQAIIDHERSFWGDPLADFVTPTIFGELDETDDLVTGYREAGGTVELTPSARTRLALYRAYLYLILLVENGPRQYPEESYARVRDLSVTHLTEILARLRTA
ncbi:aminoglycoside phosphotransferase (APT) family kinase protein [Thermocatellispora tengchongensis]|uniref:Aminoglycoside phosphotransferase (APT) family kinase protein n=1 Tax=Thermocatellispora tengchongensis TaxID=1073253 RepID=A0A840P452_9ACTN|nr:phosphotransferase [Thermocatellispora tengchongensis]MBB5132017.1 aminoglycoside phosphotransferase (APT) family kinase protein [Thermocatellispora tengchongensis]